MTTETSVSAVSPTTTSGVFDGVFDKVAGEYDTAGVTFFKPLALRLIELTSISPGARVLDVGCGRGAVTFPLARVVGPSGSVVGIDVSRTMVEEIAADIARAGIENMTVLTMDGQNPDFAPGEFDAITGSMSIVMIPDLPTAFGNYARLLRPGGCLAFTAPDTRSQTGAWRAGPVDIGRLAAEIPPAVMAQQPMLARLIEGNLLDLSAIAGHLDQAGFTSVREIREEITVVADSPAAVVRWTQQHGMRAVWDAVPADRREAVERHLIDEGTQQADDDGRVRFGFPITVYLARTAEEGVAAESDRV